MRGFLSRKKEMTGGFVMFIGKTVPFVRAFVAELEQALKRIEPDAGLTRIQKEWIGFCLVAIIVTNSVCWKCFERASLGRRSARSFSWMFRQTNRFWRFLLQASVSVVLAKYGITEGVLVVDDSEKKRAKQTTRIYKAHKVKEKKSGGFIHGQRVVLLLLVTPKVTIPVGVEFYMPDPTLTAWNAEEKRLKKPGVSKKNRPTKPRKHPNYPTIPEIALQLLQAVHTAFPQCVIRWVLADNLYGTEAFLDTASAMFGGVQVISQLRKNQNVRFQGKKMNVTALFTRYAGVKQTIRIRGGSEGSVWVSSARVHVCAHATKRFVIALKYEGEDEYRYLVAADLSWRHLDIVQAQTLRWLVEVFFQDWKAYEGWGQLTKQPDEEGSRRSLILSLLCDHCLLLHPAQLARIEDNLPAYTVGSLRDRVKVESSMQFFEDILLAENPHEQIDLMAQRAKEVFTLNESRKHMVGRDLGRLESTPSLEYSARVVMKTA
jgi:hypothetical protein